MELEGSFVIEAPKTDVWRVFMDAEALGGCVPGVERIRMLDSNRYETEMVVKVPFMTLRFIAQGELKEAVDGETLRVALTGKPVALAGMFRNDLTVWLSEKRHRQTEVFYRMQLQMTGRLASLGMILVKGTVEKSAAQFADNVKTMFAKTV
ncbi:MAG: hypothetical protein J7639_13000 [Paenibacillaceae bacterium]|nr:hypothetical protein [Paenibacillaceae bacterium]